MARPDPDAAADMDAAHGVVAPARRPVSEERRLVTGLFADLVGFTTLGEERDPEDVREVQQRYFEAVAREVEHFGGVVEKYIGDAVVAVFGVPRAHDDDAERALRAALAIRDAVAALGGLEVRIGVNTGEVVGGVTDASGGYVATGDAMNVAARLQQAAEPSAILVGPVTRRLARADFDFEPAMRLEVKGKAAPVDAAALLGARDRAIRVHLGTGGLVGRSGELQALEMSLEDAFGGRGRVVAVIGEAGIGKSRLALELCQRAADRGATVSWVAARSYASGEPYFLVGKLVQDLLGPDRSRSLAEVLAAGGAPQDPASLERWSDVLGAVLGDDSIGDGAAASGHGQREAGLTPQGRQRALVDALTAIVTARATGHPLAIVLDDVHWADQASQAVLDELVDAIAELPVLVLATARPNLTTAWAGKRHYRQVNLDSLAGADALLLARELAGDRPLSEAVTDHLLERSGGNPFFLEELMASTLAGDAAVGRLPETVQEVVLARIDALPAGPRRILQLCSVVGMEFEADLIEVLDPPADLSAALDLLRREDVIVRRATTEAGSTYVFRHPLIQEVAYRSVLLAQRRQLHGRLARHLEEQGREEQIPAIAVHYRASDDRERAQAALVRAGERAERLYATAEAAGFYHDAAELMPTDAARAALLERSAFQTYQRGEHDRAIATYREAIERYEAAGLTIRALDARRQLGRVHWTAGDRVAAEEAIEHAVTGLEQLSESPELAAAYSYRSQLLMLRPRFAEAIRWANRAIEIAERLGARTVLPHAYTNRGISRVLSGDPGGFDDLRFSLREALAQNRPDDAARAYANMSAHGEMISPLPAAQMDALHEEAIAYTSERVPGGFNDQALRQARIELRLATGRWSEAEHGLDQLSGATHYTMLMLDSLRALLAAHHGRGAEALERALPALDEIDQVEDLQVSVPRYAAILHAQRAEGAFGEVAGTLKRALDAIGELRHGPLLTYLLFEATDVALAAFRAGPPAPRAELLDLLLRLAETDAPLLAGVTEIDTSIRRALFGAALNALAGVAEESDHPAQARLASLAYGLPDMPAAAQALDAAERIFDAARVRLWAVEQDAGGLNPDVVQLFERLGARDHLRRAVALG